MRIPKPVNAVLDGMERQARPLAVVTALVAAAVAARWIPPLAGFILGIAAGGFTVHLRLSKRLARLRREADDLLRENGALRHRNTMLSSGIITREAQVTQALVSIPELEPAADAQRTFLLPSLPDDEDTVDGEPSRETGTSETGTTWKAGTSPKDGTPATTATGGPEGSAGSEGTTKPGDDPAGYTIDISDVVRSLPHGYHARSRYRSPSRR